MHRPLRWTRHRLGIPAHADARTQPDHGVHRASGTGASGRLTAPHDYTLATYTHFLHAVIDHLALPKITLIGHSHGGCVARSSLRTVAVAPRRLRCLHRTEHLRGRSPPGACGASREGPM
ncbi:alpha/beta fold hydrolase [Streptomyces sp. NBC_00316]|uniref:alpha/beta fold hydrolase n=1 Tax=Streptomyces sp. NBC_00316 TaxID=2975710 RepID=UPI002E28CFCB|nr:alpha/beta fold hydrolase [Streptomyces sp. NBC_00316]